MNENAFFNRIYSETGKKSTRWEAFFMKKLGKGIIIGTAVVVLGTTAVFASGFGNGPGGQGRAWEELPPVPHSLPHPGRVTACTVQMPMETESVIITRTDPVIMQIQTEMGSAIIIRTGPVIMQIQTATGSAITTRTEPASTQMQTATEPVISIRRRLDIMEPAITGDGETVIIKEGWKKRCEVRKKPEGPLICTGTQ